MSVKSKAAAKIAAKMTLIRSLVKIGVCDLTDEELTRYKAILEREAGLR